MTKGKSPPAPRESVQVSLPQGFGSELRAQADLHGRSMAGQLEHWARIAMAVEGLGTGPDVARLKAVPVGDAAALRLAFAQLLDDQSRLAAVVRQQVGAAAPTFGVFPDDPSMLVRTDPDGSKTVGRLNAAGQFVSIPSTSKDKICQVRDALQ